MRVFRFLGVWQRQEVRGLHAHRSPSDHLVPDRVPVCGIPWKPLLTGLLLCQWRIGLDGYKGMVVPRKRVRLWVQGIPVAGHAHLEVLV